MNDKPRLIEFAFPLKQTSLDSVHEKNVRHGHISTLHIWPARRPLAACRAALIATLLPDPGDAEKRKELCEKIAGKVVQKIERKKMPNGQVVERVKEETEGGILHWGRETENAETLEWFRKEIKKAYGGRAPKVLDPFAGGGAIPLEAMRLGCEATAVDINPVAWFILKCTLEYPQKLAGQTRSLPEFILHDGAFMAEFFKKAKGYGKAETTAAIKRLHARLKKKPKAVPKGKQGSLPFAPAEGAKTNEIDADLAWHVRAWGRWVRDRARRELAQYYPTYADFEPLEKDRIAYEHQPMRLLSFSDDGTPDIESLNAEFTADYLADKRNPRWVVKTTVAYLWARTVKCKNCRATVPLLKTRWLCKKKDGSRQRNLLTVEPSSDHTTVVFGLQSNVPCTGGNAAQKREHDKRIGAGSMSRAGAKCHCCPAIMTMEDLRVEGQAGRLDAVLTAVVVDGSSGKEFRLPTREECQATNAIAECLFDFYAEIPFGIPKEALAGKEALGFRVPLYGIDRWDKLFTSRQLLALGAFVKNTRAARDHLREYGADSIWLEAIVAFLACGVDRLVDFCNVNVQWKIDVPTINHALVRFAIQMTWDFAEGNPIGDMAGSYLLCLDRVAIGLDTLVSSSFGEGHSKASCLSATNALPEVDIIITDPPYYDAIPYSDLMDWFYVWLRRMVFDLSPTYANAMHAPLAPKWDSEKNDGELIDESSRHGGDAIRSKQAYEDGMARVFLRCASALSVGGRMVVVFANKQPDAWETLVASLIRSGFVVDGSWPIQTEQPSRTRGQSSAALASSVWLVCKKRPATARPGWDNIVLEEMRTNIAVKLREFWDAGIRGPDFVWAATGPAMEAYSKHPVVRKANEANATMGVGEFLTQVRRMVVDYIVGQVLSGQRGADLSAADRLDEVTAYYLLHRHDFGMDDAPVGACILYATACGLSDTELEKTWDILATSGKAAESADDEETDDGEDSEPDESDGDTSGGGKVKLKAWNQRRGKSLGYEAPQSKAVPLIDRIHRMMHLWKDGDLHKVGEYLDQHALRRHELFKRVVQSLIELSTNIERSLLESISNHIGAKGARPAETLPLPGMLSVTESERE